MEETKHGTWEHCSVQHEVEEGGVWTERFLKCSECEYKRHHAWLRGEQPNYCENCGADMRKVKDGK